ncbi:MAG: hypothetical protein ACE5DK_10885, partial [Paracoccaceae bacterium]
MAQPNLMSKVNTNCMGCHLQKDLRNGHAVQVGSPGACAGCHTEGHKKILADWKKQLKGEVADAVEFAAEAEDALAAARTNGTDEETLRKAGDMIAAGQEFVTIVRIGNGVHNKKYAITILDEAFGNFEDAIDLLEGGG